MNANYRNFALWVIIFLLVLALVTLFQSPGQKAPSSEITFSQLLTDADAGNVRDVTIAGQEISGHMKDGRTFQTYSPNDPGLVQTLYKKDVTITAKPPSDGNNWLLTIVSSVLPVLLFLGLWIYMTRQMQGGAGKAMGFGKSKAKLLTEAQGRVTFEDVAGVDEAKEDLQEIVEFLRDPQKFQKLGGRIPRGRAAGRPSGHRQDFDRSRGGGRSQCAVFHHLGLRLCRNVRRRRREPGARHVRAGEKERALHHLHR